jgi:Ni/Co efflux regulator RcnB
MFQTVRLTTAVVLSVFALTALAHPALAGDERPHHHSPHGHGYPSHHFQTQDDFWDKSWDNHRWATIPYRDRSIISSYIAWRHWSSCVPHYGQSDESCVRRMGAGRYYPVGSYLPHGDIAFPLAADLSVRLRPAPRGYRYVQVGQDVLLIASDSRKIMDAVTLISVASR